MIRREKEGCWAKKKEIFGRKPNMNDILLNDVDNMRGYSCVKTGVCGEPLYIL